MTTHSPNRHEDPQTLALAALAATLGDERRARRFLDLTGIGTDELRLRVGESAFLVEVIVFLEAHEPDLLSVAEAIGVKPEALVSARERLERDEP